MSTDKSLDIEQLGVFQVFTGGGTGSGFLVDKNLLVTNTHVVAPYRTVAIEQRDKVRITGKVRRLNPKRDLAIVELSQPLDGAILPVSELDDLQAKQAVDIIGFPVGLPLSITEGVVSNPKQLLDGQHFVQTDAAINPGNSGGPILDESQQIVAVTTCKLRSADMVGFGIPSIDVHKFLEGFREQTAEFGVMCPACDVLLENAERYCASCGSDLEALELATYFEPPEPHPIVEFVERGLANAKIDPVLARHGAQNWSFHSGSAPVKIWSCCSEHLCFSSPLAQPGKQKLGDLFRFLLSADHAPLSFDLYENLIRLNLTFHVSDVFAHARDDEMSAWIAQFVAAADKFDNLLVEQFGCEPAPETQLTFLKKQAR
ncbi:MAG TPA: serine protease [Kofleriaceae bacterium]|nr:serine protease [Kofleriaceae bacterium]